MEAIFEALPGLEVPVGGIGRSLARMWAEEAAGGRPAPEAEDAKATQVNFVLHLGFNTDAADAARQFATVLRFAQRYPCRVVVLCPRALDAGGPPLRAKVYGECFLGRTRADKRCVEFVMLSYDRRARAQLEDQVSICLSTDLPLYYWAHRFADSGRLADYRFLLSQAKRVILDSAESPADAMRYPWPNPAAIRDLAYCRLLPVRQSVGQFLAAYAPAALTEGLHGVEVVHGPAWRAEGEVLAKWMGERLMACGWVAAAGAVALASRAAAGVDLGVRVLYKSGAKEFAWSGDLAAGQAHFWADFGLGRTELTTGLALLAPEMALSEAMFF
jgi:hypothetical protein